MRALSYFTEDYFKGFLWIGTVAALLLSIIFYRRRPELRIFFYYTLFSLVSDFADLYAYLAGRTATLSFLLAILSTLGFVIFEYFVFANYILLQLRDRLRRKAVRIMAVAFLAFSLLLMLTWHKFVVYQGFFLLDSVLTTVSCLLYFYELFNQTIEHPLKAQPAFWIITGILLLSCCTIPLYLTIGMLGKYLETCYNLIFMLYTVLFCLIIRGYLCQPGAILHKIKPVSRENYILLRS